MELIYRTANSQTIWRNQETLLIKFPGARNIAASSELNGGIREGITSVFNHTVPAVTTIKDLPGGSVYEYLRLTARKLGVEPQACSGLLTAALMRNAAHEILTFRQLAVEAVVTAGINVNGGRAADPAAYYEEAGSFHPLTGTINILLVLNADLPPGALLKSIITATEAKTAALQELLAPSHYSTGLATGSGTDGIIVAANPDSSLALTDAGQHSKLGELIGQTVKAAVKKALARETGLSPAKQMDVLERLKRFGIDPEYLWQRSVKFYPALNNREQYFALLMPLTRQPELVALTSAIIHLQDQVQWELLPLEQAIKAARSMVAAFNGGIREMSSAPVSDKPLIDILADSLNAMVYKHLVK